MPSDTKAPPKAARKIDVERYPDLHFEAVKINNNQHQINCVYKGVTIKCAAGSTLKQTKAQLEARMNLEAFNTREKMIDALEGSVKGYKKKEMFEKESDRFERIFSLNLYHFTDAILMSICGIRSFDIIRFDEWMKRNKGYREDKHGSLSDFIATTYDQEACDLVKALLV